MDHIKVLIEIGSEDENTVEIESIWAKKTKNGYYLDNIPFYAYGLAYMDIIEVEDLNGCYYFRGLLKASGHSTIRILFSDINTIKNTIVELEKLGCSCEISDVKRLISVDIPKTIKYKTIKSFLDKGVENDKWAYEEACLGFIEPN